MARDEDAARREVVLAMSRMELGPTDLARKSGVDVKTVRSLLNGDRWPQQAKRSKIERTLGLPANALEDIAEGRPPSDDARPAGVDLAALLAEDPTLSAASRAHIVNQYRLLQQLSALEVGQPDGPPPPGPSSETPAKGSFGHDQNSAADRSRHSKGA